MTPQEVASVIEESVKTMTTAHIVRNFRNKGELHLIEPALEFLPRGLALAFADVINVRTPKFTLIERPDDENRDILQSLFGGD